MEDKEQRKDLKDIYKYVYTCDGCGLEYGSDTKEEGIHICPICEEKKK